MKKSTIGGSIRLVFSLVLLLAAISKIALYGSAISEEGGFALQGSALFLFAVLAGKRAG